jgi:hypothetical protein
VDETHAERERAVAAAARRERAAREVLERIAAQNDADEPLVREYRDRWREASSSLVGALQALKRR